MESLTCYYRPPTCTWCSVDTPWLPRSLCWKKGHPLCLSLVTCPLTPVCLRLTRLCMELMNDVGNGGWQVFAIIGMQSDEVCGVVKIQFLGAMHELMLLASSCSRGSCRSTLTRSMLLQAIQVLMCLMNLPPVTRVLTVVSLIVLIVALPAPTLSRVTYLCITWFDIRQFTDESLIILTLISLIPPLVCSSFVVAFVQMIHVVMVFYKSASSVHWRHPSKTAPTSQPLAALLLVAPILGLVDTCFGCCLFGQSPVPSPLVTVL